MKSGEFISHEDFSAKKRKILILLFLLAAQLLSVTMAADDLAGRQSEALRLVKTLETRDEQTARSAAIALGNMGESAGIAVPALVKVVQENTDSLVAVAAAKALGKIQPFSHETISGLIKALLDRGCEHDIAWAVGESLVKMGPATAGSIPALILALNDKKSCTVDGALIGLGEIGGSSTKTVPAILNWMDGNKDENLRIQASRALGNIGPAAEAAVPLLIEELARGEGFNPDDNNYAGEALGKIGPAAVPKLIHALKDGNRRIRLGAAYALTIMGDKAKNAVPALIRAVDDEWSAVQLQAIEALGEIGPLAKPAVGTLARKLREYNGHANFQFEKKSVMDSLRKIATPEALGVLEPYGAR